MGSVNGKIVGIIGLGDLGGRMTLQAESAEFDVIAYEPGVPRVPREAIDPNTIFTGCVWPPKQAESIESVFDSARIVHWCAPSSELPDLELHNGQLLILHDSVMDSSKEHARRIHGPGRVGIVHCTMNNARKVHIAAEAERSATVQHIFSLGLFGKVIPISEHDEFMAHSQAAAAYGVLFHLDTLKGHDDSDFTDSGMESYNLFANRASRWTLATLKTIFQNPFIEENERMRALHKIDELERKGYTTVNG